MVKLPLYISDILSFGLVRVRSSCVEPVVTVIPKVLNNPDPFWVFGFELVEVLSCLGSLRPVVKLLQVGTQPKCPMKLLWVLKPKLGRSQSSALVICLIT